MVWRKNNRGPAIGHVHVRGLAYEYTIVAYMSSITQTQNDFSKMFKSISDSRTMKASYHLFVCAKTSPIR